MKSETQFKDVEDSLKMSDILLHVTMATSQYIMAILFLLWLISRSYLGKFT